MPTGAARGLSRTESETDAPEREGRGEGREKKVTPPPPPWKKKANLICGLSFSLSGKSILHQYSNLGFALHCVGRVDGWMDGWVLCRAVEVYIIDEYTY